MTHPGIYRAICFDASDPEKRGRIRVQIPSLTGSDVSEWAWPVCPSGQGYGSGTYGSMTYGANSFVTAPTPGTGVWIMFEAGNPRSPAWLGTF